MLRSLLFGTICAILAEPLSAQSPAGVYWKEGSEARAGNKGLRQIVPQRYRLCKLDANAFRAGLSAAPLENTKAAAGSFISLPLPDGSTQKFIIAESPVMAEELSKAFPQIKTYTLKGVDDVYAKGRLDWNEFGLHAMVLSPAGDFFIDPYQLDDTLHYISYYTRDFIKDPSQQLPEAGVFKSEAGTPANMAHKSTQTNATCVGGTLRSYRMAVACTGEYAQAATGLALPSVAQTLSKIVTSVNRLNAVYETEVAIRFVLVPTETLVIYTNPSSDPFNGNANPNTLINESQSVINSNILSANYDIGHTFSSGSGGLAQLGCLCINGDKAHGVSGSPNPVGDPFDIDMLAHEVGHQFSAQHTFNAITSYCNGNWNGPTAVEPGSGITIMAYAGSCGANNVAGNSIPYFHGISYDEIVNYAHSGAGAACGAASSTGNQPPSVAAGLSYIVPKSTPFILTGSATDPDNDPLTYSWEEVDISPASGNWNSGALPYFRSNAPTTSPSRSFPSNAVVLTGNYTGTIGEYLPGSAQTLRFRLTARDNKTTGGGVCSSTSTVAIAASGPLHVSYPNASNIVWSPGTQTVTWDVNGTDASPVSCDSVRLLISYNSGNTYYTLVSSVKNNGYKLITVPTVTSTVNTCRIKVQSRGNIFYDIGDANFTITAPTNTTTPPPPPPPTDTTGAHVGLLQYSGGLSNLKVWPNPFSDHLSISLLSQNESSAVSIKIFDLLGNVVYEKNFEGSRSLNESIDLSQLSAGTYYLKARSGDTEGLYRLLKN